ncbi:MAG: outer-membrane lipoprotein carrier protein LolA [Pseudomonadota bacterium]
MISALFSSVAFLAASAAFDATPVSAEIPAPVKLAAVAAPAPKTTAAPVKLAAAVPPPAQPVVFSDLSDEAVAARVLSQIESLTTLSGDFVQTAPSGAVVTGKVYLRRPGQIRFDYDDPSPITIVATGGMVYVENSELETADSYPLKKTPLRFLLSKKIDIGDATLKSVDRSADAVAVTYASTGDETEGELTLVMSAPDLSIEQWAVRDPQGGVTIVALQGVSTGGTLENRLFRAPDAGGAFIND